MIIQMVRWKISFVAMLLSLLIRHMNSMTGTNQVGHFQKVLTAIGKLLYMFHYSWYVG